jgi:hypothetical protein
VIVLSRYSQIDNALKLLPGPHFEHNQQDANMASARASGQCPAECVAYNCWQRLYCMPSTAQPALLKGRMLYAGSGQRRLVVVMFIGGATFAEVAALRWLSRRPDVNSDFLICTTKLVSGNSLLSSCIDDSVLASMAQAQVV